MDKDLSGVTIESLRDEALGWHSVYADLVSRQIRVLQELEDKVVQLVVSDPALKAVVLMDIRDEVNYLRIKEGVHGR